MVSIDGGFASKVDDVTAYPEPSQDGRYVLLWQRYDNNKMVAMRYYGEVILHLQQYSHRLNLFFFLDSGATEEEEEEEEGGG